MELDKLGGCGGHHQQERGKGLPLPSRDPYMIWIGGEKQTVAHLGILEFMHNRVQRS